MGMALFSNTVAHTLSQTGFKSSLSIAVQGLKGWLATGQRHALSHTQATAAAYRQLQTPASSGERASCVNARPARVAPSAQSFNCAPSRPASRVPHVVRVVRVVDAASAAASAGRMVISGRMADVCAELDRLAALESQGTMLSAAPSSIQ